MIYLRILSNLETFASIIIIERIIFSNFVRVDTCQTKTAIIATTDNIHHR